jgi:hypothetical protein
LELLSYARNRLRCRPEYVLFNAWYSSRHLLKRIRDYSWYVVCRLEKNRRFNGQPVRTYQRHPYWAEHSWLTGGLKVLVVRYGAKYYATNRLTLLPAEVRRLCRFRAKMEEVIRVCYAKISSGSVAVNPARSGPSSITLAAVWSPSVSWSGNGMTDVLRSTSSNGSSIANTVGLCCQR